MENLCERFPHLAWRIFDQLDDFFLMKLQMLNNVVREFLDKERSYWIRNLRKNHELLKDYPKLWRPVLEKSPCETVKKIVLALNDFFYSPHLYTDKLNQEWPLIAILANFGDLELIQLFKERLPWKVVTRSERRTSFFLAANKGHSECFKAIIGKVVNTNPGKHSRLNTWARTPLHYAALNGHLEMVKIFVEKLQAKNLTVNPAASENGWEYQTNFDPGNELLSSTDSGVTPLHYACQEGHLEICKLILDNLKDDEDKNPTTKGLLRHQNTPLSRATFGGHSQVIKLFQEKGVIGTPITPMYYVMTYIFKMLAICSERTGIFDFRYKGTYN